MQTGEHELPLVTNPWVFEEGRTLKVALNHSLAYGFNFQK